MSSAPKVMFGLTQGTWTIHFPILFMAQNSIHKNARFIKMTQNSNVYFPPIRVHSAIMVDSAFQQCGLWNWPK